jgi:FkbM family methyltransferase
MTWLYFKHLLLRTPLEGPTQRVRRDFDLAVKRLRHPELCEVFLEPDRIEQMMRQVIQPDSNCIDIGCHIGSCLSSITRYAPRGRHLAFEPVPEKASWIRKKFPEVDVKAVALGDKRDKLTFYHNVSQPGLSGFTKDASSQDEIVEITVDCERLDDLVGADRTYAYVKVDVEGAELWVLKGARKMIERDRPIILFESGPNDATALGLKREDVFVFVVDELGYEVFMVKDFLEKGRALDLAGFQRAAEYPFQAANFLAIPKKTRIAPS